MKKVHFIGIGGIGLSAIARFFRKNGYEVSGSDVTRSGVIEKLEKISIKINVPHNKNVIKGKDVVVYSAAIKHCNEELMQAKKMQTPIFSRKEILPFILEDKKVFAVAGSHGKSSTTAMLASVIDGSMLLGAEDKKCKSNMVWKSCNNIIFEADESDESFLNSNPHLSIVTNTEPEHLDYYNYDIGRFYNAYRKFIEKSTIRILNAEDKFLSTLKDIKALFLHPSKDILILDSYIKYGYPHMKFKLKNLGVFDVIGIGDHVALNASLVILAGATQISTDKIRRRLKRFMGIKKRFDLIFNDSKFILIDDYAHHPTEIRATIKSARNYAKMVGINKIVAIWQPHRYSRLVQNLEQFKDCFDGIDKLVILPVWSSGEDVIDIDIKYHFKKYNPIFADSILRHHSSISILKDSKILKNINKDIVLGLGAGNISYQLNGEKY